MGKKGQSTMFVLLGLIILVLVVGLALTTKEARKTTREQEVGKTVSLPSHIRPVYDLVQECVKDTARNGLYLLGIQGGYIEPEKYYETDEKIRVAYGYYIGQKTLPSRDKMSAELSKFMDLMVRDCADFSVFSDLEISGGAVSSRLFINSDSVVVEAYYPLGVLKAGQEFKLNEKYAASYPVRMGKIYDFVSAIIDKEIKDPGNIDLTFLLDSGFDVSIIPADDENMIYSVVDDESRINEIPFVFMFANRF